MDAADALRRWAHPATCLPEPARAELARRREQILVRAEGRVLDLDEPEVVARFADVGRTTLARRDGAARASGPNEEADRFDTVVATGVLAGFADLRAIVGALAALVADDGALLFVEPVGAPGWRHLVGASIPDPRERRSPWQSLHLDRDVPAVVRDTGLVVCDLDRGELPSQPWSLRHWVSGRAVRIVGA